MTQCKLRNVRSEVGEMALAHLHPPSEPYTGKYIGWTINIPTNYKIPVTFYGGNGRKSKREVIWDFLNHDQQLNYLKMYIVKVVLPNIDNGLLVFEQTKRENIHVHIICYDPVYQNDYDIAGLRASVRHNMHTMKIAKTDMARHKRLNYIHYLEDPEDWFEEYMQKDFHKHGYPVYKIAHM